MLTVADELFISGLDDDTRAIVERYVASEVDDAEGRADEAEGRADKAEQSLADIEDGDMNELLLEAYQEGWKGGVEHGGEAPSVLPPHLGAAA